MIISICGISGSGKSTISKLLAERLGYKHYSIGEIRRKMAVDRGMTLAELNKLGEKEDFTDKEVDKFQEELGKKEDNFVIDGRTSFHFIP
ncbi:MAG: AAA family ATPase, partial [Candidatus Aenigmatarchaeota archaeon]